MFSCWFIDGTTVLLLDVELWEHSIMLVWIEKSSFLFFNMYEAEFYFLLDTDVEYWTLQEAVDE